MQFLATAWVHWIIEKQSVVISGAACVLLRICSWTIQKDGHTDAEASNVSFALKTIFTQEVKEYGVFHFWCFLWLWTAIQYVYCNLKNYAVVVHEMTRLELNTRSDCKNLVLHHRSNQSFTSDTVFASTICNDILAWTSIHASSVCVEACLPHYFLLRWTTVHINIAICIQRTRGRHTTNGWKWRT